MPTYKFRSGVDSPHGAIHPVGLDLRVLASLQDAEAAGILVQYDWSQADIGADSLGDYVVLEIDWPEPAFGVARQYIDAHSVTVEWPAPEGLDAGG